MRSFIAQHLAALQSALGRLVSSPFNSLLSLLAIGTVLALPSAGWLVLDNLNGIAGNASGVQQISIFMAIDASKKDLNEVESRLREAKPGNWNFVSRDEAMKRLKTSDGMAEIIAGLPKNPLPDAFIVEPADTQPESLERLANAFSGWPKVAHVQLDSQWMKRFDAFMRLGELSIALITVLFAGALIAVTFNTIRLQILAHAAEIEVARLIGATDAFIRRPFQYYGALQGTLGGLFAVLLVGGGSSLLARPASELVALYGGSFLLRGLLPGSIIAIALIGTALGWLGARFSVAAHLRSMR